MEIISLISKNLFEEVLIHPFEKGYDNLLIVSGYGTPSFAHHHLEALGNRLSISLIVGMTSKKAVSQIQHANFVDLTKRTFEVFNKIFDRSISCLDPLADKVGF